MGQPAIPRVLRAAITALGGSSVPAPPVLAFSSASSVGPELRLPPPAGSPRLPRSTSPARYSDLVVNPPALTKGQTQNNKMRLVVAGHEAQKKMQTKVIEQMCIIHMQCNDRRSSQGCTHTYKNASFLTISIRRVTGNIDRIWRQ